MDVLYSIFNIKPKGIYLFEAIKGVWKEMFHTSVGGFVGKFTSYLSKYVCVKIWNFTEKLAL